MHRILITGPNSQWTSDLITGQAFNDCVVEVASGVLDTLRRLRQRHFELVITDHQTSFAEDLELFEEMGHTRPGLKTIILAPKTTPEEVIAALRSQVFAVFSLPCSADDLSAMVAVALESEDWRGGIQVVSARRDWVELRVECHLLTAERLVCFMTELASDVAHPQRAELIMAFREILLNAMEHGAGFQSEKVVEVAAVRTARAFVYYYRDPGAGFELEALPHAAISSPDGDPFRHLEYRAAAGMRAGGFGILMTKQLVDQIIYSELGNEVILIRYTDLPQDTQQVWPHESAPASISH
jgi:anti-sigma regulatory factor (Ser/Thr protein kinase)